MAAIISIILIRLQDQFIIAAAQQSAWISSTENRSKALQGLELGRASILSVSTLNQTGAWVQRSWVGTKFPILSFSSTSDCLHALLFCANSSAFGSARPKRLHGLELARATILYCCNIKREHQLSIVQCAPYLNQEPILQCVVWQDCVHPLKCLIFINQSMENKAWVAIWNGTPIKPTESWNQLKMNNEHLLLSYLLLLKQFGETLFGIIYTQCGHLHCTNSSVYTDRAQNGKHCYAFILGKTSWLRRRVWIKKWHHFPI